MKNRNNVIMLVKDNSLQNRKISERLRKRLYDKRDKLLHFLDDDSNPLLHVFGDEN
ncbi:MAG: hypothetical protein IJP90_12595 [Treponema sp.]|nr:hypothetical protein [Treponema sp.]